MLELFVDDIKGLRDKLFKEKDGKTLLVLSEPLCDLETRERIFRDIIDAYGNIDGRDAVVMIKQHPRDYLDYTKAFPDAIVLDGSFPMEMLNFIEGLSFVDSINFVKEKHYLGDDFMDKYEAPEIHRQNEAITD